MPMWRRNERPMNRYAAGSKLENAPTGGALPALTALTSNDEAGALELHARLRVGRQVELVRAAHLRRGTCAARLDRGRGT